MKVILCHSFIMCVGARFMHEREIRFGKIATKNVKKI